MGFALTEAIALFGLMMAFLILFAIFFFFNLNKIFSILLIIL